MAKKRARERRDINVRLVEIFEDLASENEKVRLEAARLLLARENLSHEDVRSTFRRLVRGLCSGRKAARLGFSVALTEFLVHYSFVQSSGHDDLLLSNEEVLKLIREQTHLNGDSTGQVCISNALIQEHIFIGGRREEIITWVGFLLLKQRSNPRLSSSTKIPTPGVRSWSSYLRLLERNHGYVSIAAGSFFKLYG